MFLRLEKEQERVGYKIGAANYIWLGLIPFVGSLITLILSIQRKQFRGFWLNKFIVDIIIAILLSILAAISIDTENETLYFIGVMIDVIISIGILWNYASNANYYSIKQRLSEGYIVMNDDEPEIAQAVEKAERVELPFWQMTKF